MGNDNVKPKKPTGDSKHHHSSPSLSNRYYYAKRKKSPINQSGSGSSSSSFSSASASAKDNKDKTITLAGHAGAPGGPSWSTSSPSASAADAAESAWPECMHVKPVNEIVKNYLTYDVLTSLDSIRRFYIWSKDDITIYQAHAIARDHVLKADGKPAKCKATVVVVDEKNPDAPPSSADSFAALDAAVIANPAVLQQQITITVKRDGEDHTFQGTLETIAMANLGFTISSENPQKPMVSEGRAERLRGLRERLLRHTVPLALEQAQLALPKQQDAKAIEARKKALNAAFDKIKEKNPAAAQKILRDYVNSTKPAVITDGSYYLNLLQTYIDGLNMLINRGSKELTDSWYGPQGDQYFCVLGMILRPFSMDLREILMTGAWYVLRDGRPVARNQDTSDQAFISAAGLEVGVSCSYDDIGRACAGAYWRASDIFQSYVSNYICAANLMRRSNIQPKNEALTLSNFAKGRSQF